MKPINDLTLGELAAFICSHLKSRGIDVVLSGGGCVAIYSQGKYLSLDLDFIEYRYVPRKRLKQALSEVGFHEENRYFRHTETKYFLEFPAGPLSVGTEPVKEIHTLHFSTGDLTLISPTDCIKDRLAAYYYWHDRQALEQAVMVSRENEVDLEEIERWSGVEGKAAEFQEIKNLFKSSHPGPTDKP